MNKKTGILGLGILTVLLIGSFSFSVFAQDQQLSIIESKNNSNSAKFIPGQLVVGLERPDPSFNDKVSLHGGQVINSIDQINAIVVKVPLNTEDKFISAISKNPNVVYVERDAIITASYIPEDQFFGIQWGVTRIGMESAWEGNPSLGTGIIVAVVDTGIYPDHPDFAGTTIRTDLDYDFIDNDNDTRPTNTCGNSAEYHGTFVAGVIAATKDNTIGVAGIGPFDILPVRVLNNCGSGSSSGVASGIIWAVDHGADVINLSLGSPVPSNTILNAVNYAHAWPGDAVIVAASGNDGTSSILYPAGFANVISVGATTNTDAKASYSQYGSTLELTAPGGSSGACSSSGTPYIVSTGVGVSGGSTYFSYQCGTGTSFAAPHVSGVAGLVKAANPSASNEEIRLHLQQTAEDLTPLDGEDWDEYFGYGLVRADVALSYLINPVGLDTVPPVITLVGANPQFIEVGNAYVELGATASDNYDGNISGSIVIDSLAVNTSVLGDYSVTYDVDDSSGNSATTVTRTVTVEDTAQVDPDYVHVGDLNWQASDKKNWNAVVYITVHDGESLVSGVLVDATFTDPNNTSFSVNCTTVDGICKVNKTTKLDYLIFTVDYLDSTPVSTITTHHDDDGDFDYSGIPTATINKGVNSVGDSSDGGSSPGGGETGGWDCDAKPHPKKC